MNQEYKLQVGPIQFLVKNNSGKRLVCKKINLDPYIDNTNSKINKHVPIIIEAPKSSIETQNQKYLENPENWRFYPAQTAKQSHLLQVWSGDTSSYSIECEIDQAWSAATVRALKDHPQQNELMFLVTTLLRWMTSQIAVSLGGVLVHTSAIRRVDGSGVFLGMGPSGAGKSTLSKLMLKAGGYEVLTDEMCLILAHENEYLAYGTPWYGTAKKWSAHGGPLVGIYFLEKAKNNQIRKVSMDQTILRFWKEVFLPPWSEETTIRALDNVNSILAKTPTGELGFEKSPSVGVFMEGIL